MRAAERYAEWRRASRVQERPLLELRPLPSELELQARWFAGDFGREFQLVTGEPIRIVQFGVWNRESGPDFGDVAIEFAGKVEHGAVELDLADRNWESHGHAANPAFDHTILHVFFERRGQAEFFTRTSVHRQVPQVLLDPNILAHEVGKAAPLAHPGRCVGPLRDYGDEKISHVLHAAAEFRLQRKAERLRQRIAAHGREEALYQALADALGYKQNRTPFTLLAQRLPLTSLRRAKAEPLLFGVAGFLRDPLQDQIAPQARGYHRQLWDDWWKERDRFARLILPPEAWRMSGARPLNHPHRRLGALGAILRNWKTVVAAFNEVGSAELERVLAELSHPFWQTHFTLAAAPITKPQALLGRSRSVEILANVFHPLALLEGRRQAGAYEQLRAELTNRSLETSGTRLFADSTRARKFLRTVAGQQGLLQIYEDFCQRDISDCADCPFPEQMRRW